jgi:hypothetical protein
MDKHKLNVKELKAIIKQYRKEKPITGMKKAKLQAHAGHLQKNGILKKKATDKEGAGIADLFKSQKLELSNTAKDILAKFGNLYIRNINLFTEEVVGISHASANIATLGALSKFSKKTGTKLFHIGCIITLANGQEVKFEKEEIPMLKTDVKLGPQAKFMNVPLKGKFITLRKLISNTEKYMTPEKFYTYEGLRNNCQDFMMGMLKGNNLINPELEKWGKQDITELISEVPTVNEKIMNAATGLKARIRSVTGYGPLAPAVDFNKKNEEIKQALNTNKNIQTAEYIADLKKKNDFNTDNAIGFLVEHPKKLKRDELLKLPKEELMNLFWAEYALYLQGVRKSQGFDYDDKNKTFSINGKTFKENDTKGMDSEFELINIRKLREAQGFVYNPATKDFTFEGKKYPQDDERSMSAAFANYFDRVDKENSCAYTLGEYAFTYGYSYDEENKKWYMINPHLGIRQYIEDINQARAMGNPNYTDTRDIWKSAFKMSYQLAKDNNSYWDTKYNAYKAYSKDLMSKIDDFTGGIFSQVLSLAPPPFNAGVKLLQGLSKFMTGSETGNIAELVDSVDYKNLKKLAGKGKSVSKRKKKINQHADEESNEISNILSLRCQLSNKLGKTKLNDTEIVNHLEQLHGSGALKDLFAHVVSKVANAVVAKPKHDEVKSSSLVPDTKILYKMNEASYSKEPKEVESYVRILKTPYLSVYKDARTAIVAVRGTEVKDSKDLVADIAIALGALKSTPRFKSDVEELRKLRKQPELKNLYWIGTGHSLGSALVDEFLKLGLISEAVTFNGAVSREFYNVNNKNRRIYLKNDPLYLMMGRNTKYHEVRDTKMDITKAHGLKNFEGGRKR